MRKKALTAAELGQGHTTPSRGHTTPSRGQSCGPSDAGRTGGGGGAASHPHEYLTRVCLGEGLTGLPGAANSRPSSLPRTGRLWGTKGSGP